MGEINGGLTMADDLSKNGPQDPRQIKLSENYELRYWTEKLGVTAGELREAVKKVGNSAEAVEKELTR
jgi:hypothetical protein